MTSYSRALKQLSHSSKPILATSRRGLPILGGLTVVGLVFFTPQMYQPDGFLKPTGWFFAISGLAMGFLGAGQMTCWQRSGALLAVALVGEASALQLLEVGPSIRLQHYFSWSDLLSSARGLFLLGLMGQTVVTIWTARVVWPTVKACISRLLTRPQIMILLALMAFAGVIFSRSVFRYAAELVLAGWVCGINALNLVLVVASLPVDAQKQIVDWLKRRFVPGFETGIPLLCWDRLLPWMIAGWVILISSVVNWLAFDRIPHIPDSVAYLFQAKYFADGRLYLPSPPDAAAFAIPHTINDGSKWYSIFPPGWPAILAIGVWLGVPWLVNPVLGGLTVLLVHTLISQLYTRGMAHMVVGLLAVSPMFLFMSASFMSHPLSVVCILIALIGVHNARICGSAWWAGIGGLALGGLVLTRPFEGVLVAIVIGLWVMGVGAKRLALAAVLVFGLTSLTIGGLLSLYNHLLTGKAAYDPITKSFDEQYYPGSNRLGFGSDIGNIGWTGLDPLPGHGPVDVVVNANQNFYMLNFELFGWSFGSLWFVLLLLLSGRWTKTDTVFLMMVLLIIGGLSFYWFSGGPDLGARYWYQTLVPMTVLTVRGVQTVREQLGEFGSLTTVSHRIGIFITVASLVAFVNVIPWRIMDKYHHYRGMRPDIRDLSQVYDFGHSLVLIRSKGFNPFPEYSSASILNPPSLDKPGTIYARDLSAPHTAILLEHFTDRPVWVVASPSLTGSGIQVIAGPITGESLKKLIQH